MTLRALLDPAGGTALSGTLDVEITGLALDSRRVRPGDAFFALAGANADGSAFVRDAERAGAAAVVARRGTAWPPMSATARIEVEDPRIALALAARRFTADPATTLDVIAVTGTNGKTTTTYLAMAMLEHAGIAAGVIGTTGVRFRDQVRASALTTPDAIAIYESLATLRDDGARALVAPTDSSWPPRCSRT
ncbi:MAG: hypothetical protein HOP12_13665 [Candidatus Eisenbacteria bacterium]|uniref:Mur ligase N-terminal catalytic domain-containing protein n=1 Tax=Eiseniibacteriota bacterium TaxID=2212470 RepID=A0A849T1M8_UNCEI|nr:hypothetical protein [Candidatus Eisenbacteria bacterium]